MRTHRLRLHRRRTEPLALGRSTKRLYLRPSGTRLLAIATVAGIPIRCPENLLEQRDAGTLKFAAVIDEPKHVEFHRFNPSESGRPDET